VKRFVVGPLIVNSAQHAIFYESELLSIAPKPFDLLLLLLENAGQVVSREALRKRIWGDSFVEEAVISRNVSLLRSTLRPYLGDGSFIETIPKRGYRYIGKVKVEDYETNASEFLDTAAPDNAVELIREPDAVLGSDATAPLLPSLEQPIPGLAGIFTRRRSKLVAWTAFSVLLGLVLAFTARAFIPRVTTPVRPTMALLEFRDLSGDSGTQWLGVALEESLAAELSRDHGAIVASGDQSAAAERDLGIRNSSMPTGSELRGLGRRLGSQTLLLGSFLAVGGQVRVDLALYDARTGKIVDQFSDTAPQAQLQDMIGKATRNLRSSMHLPATQGSPVLQSLNRDLVAAQFYAEGLRLVRSGEDAPRAQVLLSHAVQADPQSPQAHAALSIAWKRLGYSQEADREAQLALDTSASLPLQAKLLLRATAYSQLTDYPQAIDALKQLRQLDPQDPEYSLRLASALTQGNRLDEAWTILLDLEKPGSSIAANARVPLGLTDISSRRGDLKGVLVYAGQAVKLAQADGSRSEQADALMQSGTAWSNLGNYDRGMSDLQGAEQLYLQVGDRFGAVNAVLLQSSAMQSHDDPLMEVTARRGLAAAQLTGAQDLIAGALLVLGNVQLTHDREEDAIVTYKQVADIAEKIHATALAQRTLSDLGTAEFATYKIDVAKTHVQQALVLARTNELWSEAARCTAQLAEINSYLGLFDRADAESREAVEEFTQLGQTMRKNDELYDLGDLLLTEGKLQDAHKTFDRIDIRSMSLGNLSLLRTDQARLTAEEGNAISAESLAAAASTSANSINYSMIALELVAELQLRQGDLAKARLTVAKMAALQKSIPADKSAEMNVALLQARIEIENGNLTEADKSLNVLLDEADNLRDKQMQLQIRVAQAYSKKLAGHGAQALQTAKAEANHSGFGLIARSAARYIAT
jgi:DNA-binding winged helix-turn-helix (wHTH) protein/TolB-like protein/Tfp pilus assembly protein PilF